MGQNITRYRRQGLPRSSPAGLGGSKTLPDLDDLTDVDTTGVADGDALVWDDGTDTWVAAPVVSSLALDDLTDVDTSGLADGDALVYDSGSSEWVPGTVGGTLTVTEPDGTPSVAATEIQFPNGSVTDLGSGVASVRDVPQAFIGASIYKSTDQNNITTSGITKVTFDSVQFDSDAFFDNGNDRLTVSAGMGGKYLLTGSIGLTGYTGASVDCHTFLSKNGTQLRTFMRGNVESTQTEMSASFGFVVDLVAGDYIEMNAAPGNLAGNVVDIRSGIWTRLEMVKLDSGKVGAGIGASAYNSNYQSVADGAETALTFDSEEFDTDGFHSTGSNTSRMTIPAGLGGKYLIMADSYADSPLLLMQFRKNGTTAIRGGYDRHGDAITQPHALSTSAVVDLAAGEYVEAMVYQVSGGAINFGYNALNAAQSTFSIMRLDSGSAGILGVWTTFTPTVTMSGGGFALGNGVLQGRYKLLDSATCQVSIFYQRGSTTTNGTGDMNFALPFTTASNLNAQTLSGYFLDDGTAYYSATCRIAAATNATNPVVIADSGGTRIFTHSNPVTLATGDAIALSGILEVVP